MSLSIIILAAGRGERMHSSLPKVLHKIGGKCILEHVIQTAFSFTSKIFVVYGHGGEQVKASLQHLEVNFIYQQTQAGTGHAVLQAMPFISPEDQVLVLMGDCPLICQQTLRQLLQLTSKDEVGLVTTEMPNPHGFGRILLDQANNVIGIVEHKDATEEQRLIKRINAGIFTLSAALLNNWLPRLTNDNQQQEYYLTDIIKLAAQEKIRVKQIYTPVFEEVLGVNDRCQLAQLERFYQKKVSESLMLQGVTIYDPQRVDIRGQISCGKDIEIDINVILAGIVTIGNNCKIGANCILRDVTLGDNVTVNPNSLIEGAIIENDAIIGPFARIRPETHLKAKVKIGNFVEIKKSTIDENSKVNHLAYIGDATVGKNVNVGAGTITCNYDGVNKYQTTIGDDVFIGSDTQLIAPIYIGEGATIGAGSTITKNAPPHKLTVSRPKQVTVDQWQRPKRD